MNRKHYIVGLFGPSESGKGTVAEELSRQLSRLGYKNIIYGLAWPLADACKVLESYKGNPEWRTLVCGIGDIVRKIDIDYLWKMFERNIMGIHGDPTVFILNDPRYKDQAAHCDLVVKLFRSTAKSKMTLAEATHATEMEWGYIDSNLTFENESSDDPIRIASMIMERIVQDTGKDWPRNGHHISGRIDMGTGPSGGSTDGA